MKGWKDCDTIENDDIRWINDKLNERVDVHGNENLLILRRLMLLLVDFFGLKSSK